MRHRKGVIDGLAWYSNHLGLALNRSRPILCTSGYSKSTGRCSLLRIVSHRSRSSSLRTRFRGNQIPMPASRVLMTPLLRPGGPSKGPPPLDNSRDGQSLHTRTTLTPRRWLLTCVISQTGRSRRSVSLESASQKRLLRLQTRFYSRVWLTTPPKGSGVLSSISLPFTNAQREGVGCAHFSA